MNKDLPAAIKWCPSSASLLDIERGRRYRSIIDPDDEARLSPNLTVVSWQGRKDP